ncbi:uncharacterized protein TRIADDRAFT_58828 [Trichoplax adhaerens]|uniref:UBX domain-containing protein n=1 Tax=Trichoplax adhaerens TaxID=10228 RepID=B3S3S4_TRIAD|nr:hypothetical protein TRIADDRAFT_58828 [Trichoplax adhaerens]EDV22331.1 hypothetical protein TRIADDRAFT_58828 [Trichoplax adhaerens]|eukprot:XP_002114875.1 hypothetical protein TRIADDRAFT_58828 [Trichoplax adhaerens]
MTNGLNSLQTIDAAAFNTNNESTIAQGRNNDLDYHKIEFAVSWQEDTIILEVPTNRTVGFIKEQLQNRLGISRKNQILENWPNNTEITIDDNTVISSLMLPDQVNLNLLTTSTADNNSVNLIRADQCEFIVHNSGGKFTLHFPWCTTLREDGYILICSILLQITLQDCDLPPVYSASVALSYDFNKAAFSADDDIDGNDDDDNCDSMDLVNIKDNYFNSNNQLMPDDWKDLTLALSGFSDAFEIRYGPMHPLFFIGPLKDALDECFKGNVNQRKPLFVYIHNSKSVQVNIFCSNVLCSESIVNYLNQNYVNWAWDVTLPSNREKCFSLCTSLFGATATFSLERFEDDDYPIMLVITKVKSSLEISRVLQAKMSLDELFTGLMGAFEDYRHVLHNELKEEEAREARQRFKKLQDAEYEASLKADRAKAEQRAAEEEERNRLEKEAQLLREHEEQALMEEVKRKEAERQSLAQSIPQAPPDNCTDDVIKFLIRLPGGERLSRKFYSRNTVKDLLNYVASNGFLDFEFKVVTNFPKREISALDPHLSLGDAGFLSQDTLFVQDR